MIADLPVFPYVIGGGLLLAVVCGLFLSAAALIAGIIRRRSRRPGKTSSNSESTGSNPRSPDDAS